ncbi:MAG: TIGR02449 family protein [Gammaproteobacteria bacterium]|nr:TIGR02449 family protein [Gammaproteobacteria bacterium]
MGKTDSSLLNKKDLNRLESRVNNLIQAYEDLKKENSLLKAQQDSYTAERASLIDKNEQARKRVEAMIIRLKSMEVSI